MPQNESPERFDDYPGQDETDPQAFWRYYKRHWPALARYRNKSWNATFNRNLLITGWFDESARRDDRFNARALFYARIGRTNVSRERLRYEDRPDQWGS